MPRSDQRIRRWRVSILQRRERCESEVHGSKTDSKGGAVEVSMGDLISRAAAIDAIEHITSSMSVCVNTDECHGMKRMQRQAVIELANLPSAKPEITLESAIDYLHSIGWMQAHDRTLTESARKKGRWIYRPEIGWGDAWVCSECEEITKSTIMGKPRYNFCPMCGADMRGGDDE